VTHLVNALFFIIVLASSLAMIAFLVRDYWAEIGAALRGEMPARSQDRSWVNRSRTASRPRPVVTRAAKQPPQRAAA